MNCLTRRIVLVDIAPGPAIDAERPVLSSDSLGKSKNENDFKNGNFTKSAVKSLRQISKTWQFSENN